MNNSIQYTAYHSNRRIVVLIAGLAALSLLMVLVDWSELLAGFIENSSSRRAGTLSMLLGVLPWVGGLGLVGVAIKLPSLFRKSTAVEIGDDGVFYPKALKEVLPWDRVDKVSVKHILGFPVLAINIKDADSFPIRPLARHTAKINRMSDDYGDFNIETMEMTGDFADLVNAVNRYVEAHV